MDRIIRCHFPFPFSGDGRCFAPCCGGKIPRPNPKDIHTPRKDRYRCEKCGQRHIFS